MKENRELAKNTILLSIGTILNKGLQFIMIPFFSAWLSSEDYGTFDLLCTYVTLLIPIVTLASSNAVFRLSIEADETKKEKSKFITNGFVLDSINIGILSIIFILSSVLLKWNLANTQAKVDLNGNIQPSKLNSKLKRIDGCVSLIVAYAVLTRYKTDYENMIG